MWIAISAAWIAASAALYIYLVATARDPKHQECMDCNFDNCLTCPRASAGEDLSALKRAA